MTPPIAQDAPRHARPSPLTQAERLIQEAATAAEVRAWQTHPDVVALRVEGIRTQVDQLMWAGIVLGLCFTMTNVQTFAAAGAPVRSLAWWSAWLLDPMVSLVLLAVLRAEQLTTRYQVSTGAWPRMAKWVLLTATYVMNTWASWAAGSAAGVVLHSVPPLVVVIAAEAITDLQYALTECVHRAHTTAARRAAQDKHPPRAAVGSGGDDHGAGPVDERSGNNAAALLVSPAREHGQLHPRNTAKPVANRSPRPVTQDQRRRSRAPMRRKLLADYLAEARAAWTPGQVVTPAWVRQVTQCSRGLSSKIATTLNAELATAQHPTNRANLPGRAA
jgi:hypothetical protein